MTTDYEFHRIYECCLRTTEEENLKVFFSQRALKMEYVKYARDGSMSVIKGKLENLSKENDELRLKLSIITVDIKMKQVKLMENQEQLIT